MELIIGAFFGTIISFLIFLGAKGIRLINKDYKKNQYSQRVIYENKRLLAKEGID